MRVSRLIDRPIFIVGCGRSGTTLLYQMLATHPDVGWISNYVERWPRVSSLNALSPLYRAASDHSRLGRVLPQPSEGHKVWDIIDGRRRRPVDGGPRSAAEATEPVRARACALFGRQLARQRRTRLLNKSTQNTCRVEYLNALFPDCVIVHVIRNPVAVVESLLRVEWWPTLRAWPFDGATPRAWVRDGGREEVMAATIWQRETELAIHDGKTLGCHRYIEVRFEEFVANPDSFVRALSEFAGLAWSSTVEHRLNTFNVHTGAASQPRTLTPNQMAAITPIVEPLASQLGYLQHAHDQPTTD